MRTLPQPRTTPIRRRGFENYVGTVLHEEWTSCVFRRSTDVQLSIDRKSALRVVWRLCYGIRFRLLSQKRGSDVANRVRDLELLPRVSNCRRVRQLLSG